MPVMLAMTTIRLRRVVGTSFGFTALGSGETALPFPPIPGMTIYVDPIQQLFPLLTSGPQGIAAAGGLDFPITFDLSMVGLRQFLQAFVTDLAHPLGVVASNGVEGVVGVE